MQPLCSVFVLFVVAQFASPQTYFPQNILSTTAARSEARSDVYSKFLRSFHEPSLFELAQKDQLAEAYRFLWLREYDHPVVIRFAVKPNGTGWFYRRVESGTGLSQPGRITDYGMSYSWKSRTNSFRQLLESTGFWNLRPADESSAGSTTSCTAHWIIEAVRNGQYHVVDRCSPDMTDPVRVIAMKTMKLGSLRSGRRNVY